MSLTTFGPNKWRLRRLKTHLVQITIEPVMFLIFLSSSMVNINYQEIVLIKSCKMDFHFSDEICEHLVLHKEENTIVQNEIVQFSVYMKLIANIFPLLLCFYFGAWCDLIGRKTIMYSTIIGQIIAGIFHAMHIGYFYEWPKEYYLFTVLLPSIIFGQLSSMKMAANAFITDITSPSSRVSRLGLVNLLGLIGKPIGNFLGGVLIAHSGYTVSILVSLSCQILSILYIYFLLQKYKWQPISEKKKSYCELIHPSVMKDTLVIVFKKRKNLGNIYLYGLYIISFLTLSTTFMEREISYSYVRTRYEWEITEFSRYQGISQLFALFSQIIIIPILNHFNIEDTIILNLVLLCLFLRYFIIAFASNSIILYIGHFVDILGTNISPIIHTIMASLIPKEDIGRVFTMYSCLENLVPIITSQFEASLWQMTSEAYPGALFLTLALSILICQIIGVILYFKLRTTTNCISNSDSETMEANIHM